MKHWQHLTAIAFTLCPWHPLSVLIRAAGTDFRFVPGVTTWSEARSVCQGLGGDLATIFNAQENLAVLSILPSGDTQAWIGGHDAGRNNTFEWVDGSPLSDQGYSNWASGEPSHVYGPYHENCVQMRGGLGGTWNDAPCSRVDGSSGAYLAATSTVGCMCRIATTGESERVRIFIPRVSPFPRRAYEQVICVH